MLDPCTLAPSACSGPQSSLAPAAPAADRIADLFWWMSGGALLISLAMVILAACAIYLPHQTKSKRWNTILVVGGGVVFPTVVLSGLLIYGLALIPPFTAPAKEGSQKIVVIAEQYWWRVRYLLPDGRSIELANEIRLPLGKEADLRLESRDVIHSFWIPALSGKVDMIPGRQNRLRLEANKSGKFRGTCGEYCGASHAFMSFWVVVDGEAEFQRWLAAQAEDARAVTSSAGRDLFLANGCGACHTIRGTAADGVIGPDLTHVGGRLTVGAGLLATSDDHLRRWISSTKDLKPGARMPAFGMLPEEELRALASYLEALK